MNINKNLKIILIIFLTIIAICFCFSKIDNYLNDSYNEDVSSRDCNVVGIELHGELVTYISNEYYSEDGYLLVDQTASEDVVYSIEAAEANDSIKAIIIEIDSYGGSPVAGEEIENALKRAVKPTVILIRDVCLSAAYYAAIGADIVFASKNSDIGSIGVTMSYLDYAERDEYEGVNYNQLSSGKFKDAGSPDKILTTEERNLFMRDVNIMNENFMQEVAWNRDLDIERVRAIADGSSMLGEMALENSLIDRVGGMHEVKEYLGKLLNEDIGVCW